MRQLAGEEAVWKNPSKRQCPFCAWSVPVALTRRGPRQVLEATGQQDTAGTRQGVGRERVEGPSAQGFYLLRAAGTGLSPVFPQDLCPGAVSPAPGEESSLLL